MPTLDLDLLRTLSAVQETGTLARASRRVGRTLSAVSLQLKRLESQCGLPLFRRAGRRLELNAEGERVLAVGRRMLSMNDQLLEGLRGDVPGATIRLGLPQDVAERLLPPALTRFNRAHPRVQLEVRVERNDVLRDLLSRALLDLAITFDPESGRPDPEEIQHPVRWLACRDFRWSPGTPLPLVLFEPPCTFRRLALDALDRAGIPWRIAFTSPSLSGLWAAAAAGLGVTSRTELGAPPRVVRCVDRRLPALPSLAFRVEGASDSAPLSDLRTLLIEVLREAGPPLTRGRRGSPRPAPRTDLPRSPPAGRSAGR